TLIDMTIALMELIADNETRFKILNDICLLSDPYIIERVISIATTKTGDNYLHQWLKSESAGRALIAQTSLLIHASIESSAGPSAQRDLDILWRLISHCFADNSFKREYIEEVIDKFRVAFQDSCRSSSATADHLLDFTCRLASQLFTSYELCTELSSARDLLLTIFSMNCRVDDPSGQLRTAWRSGVANIVRSNGAYLADDGIIARLALEIRSRLQTNITSIENAELTYRCAFDLLNTIYETINASLDTDDDEEKKSLLSDPNTALLLELMLLTDTEWCELHHKCDTSVHHYDWLTSDTLFDPAVCEMLTSKSLDTTGQQFVFSAVASVILIEKLLETHSQTELSGDLSQTIVSQLNHVFIASAYVSLKSKSSPKSTCFSRYSDIFTESLANVLRLTKSSDLRAKVGDILLKKSIDDNGLNRLAFGHYIDSFIEKDPEFGYEFSFENQNYNKIVTFQKYSQILHQNFLNDHLVQSVNAFVCCDRFIQLDDGIGKLAAIHSCLKHIEPADELTHITETVTTIMETFCGLKAQNSGLFYYKNDITADSDLQFYSLIIQTFTVIVNKFCDKLTQNHWDLMICSATSWLMNIINQKEKLSTSLAVNLFAAKVFNLIEAICRAFSDRIGTASADKYPPNLVVEWNEFHSHNIFLMIIPYYLETCGKELDFYGDILMNHLSKTVSLFPDS
ncbi:unnamed protein product, partial [Medioppia subpectinata]